VPHDLDVLQTLALDRQGPHGVPGRLHGRGQMAELAGEVLMDEKDKHTRRRDDLNEPLVI
jgi:hypothetical protein